MIMHTKLSSSMVGNKNAKGHLVSDSSREVMSKLKWKGDDAGYQAMHIWIRKTYGNANHCEFADNSCKGRFEWSNKNHSHSRDVNDYQQLCSSHHARYDRRKKS